MGPAVRLTMSPLTLQNGLETCVMNNGELPSNTMEGWLNLIGKSGLSRAIGPYVQKTRPSRLCRSHNAQAIDFTKIALFVLEDLAVLLFFFVRGMYNVWRGQNEVGPGLMSRLWTSIRGHFNHYGVCQQNDGNERPNGRPNFPSTSERIWHRIRGGRLGPLRQWVFWIRGFLAAGISIGGNLVTARIIKLFPGYGHVPYGQLVLLWCTRPRLDFLYCLLILLGSPNLLWANRVGSFALCEVILQCVGSVYLMTTADEGRKRGFYYAYQLQYNWRGIPAYLMYIGALIWCLTFFVFVVVLFFFIFLLNRIEAFLQEQIRQAREKVRRVERDLERKRRTEAENRTIINPLIDITLLGLRQLDGSNTRGHNLEQREQLIRGDTAGPNFQQDPYYVKQKNVLVVVLVLSGLSFFAQWLFWGGFIDSAGDR